MRSVREVLSAGIVIGVVLITLTAGTEVRKSNASETASPSESQKSESTPISGPNRPDPQVVGKGVEGKYTLLVQSASSASTSQETLPITVTLRNESQNVIYVVDTGKPWDFTFQVKDTSKRAVPPRMDDQQLQIIEGGKRSLEPVNAGQEVSYVFDLSSLYPLSSGEYTITVRKDILLEDKQTIVEVTSAPLRLVVTTAR